MFDADCRPMGRLFYWVTVVIAVLCVGFPVASAAQTTTTIADTVYLADGTTASGVLIITWPSFVTSSGTAVAGGATNVTLGTNGALSVALVPNVGATPAGSYYTVVYQLGPGEVKTEYWLVPTTSPTNLATVRTTPGSGTATQPVSIQFVDTALAAKANDNAVVHLSGTETISGAKSFSVSPSVPAPTATGQVATKGYVDTAVSTVGAGNYLSLAGGTLTGPISLPGNPTSALQAAAKQYVDQVAATKADLVTGLVPVSELGSGSATSGSCLLGNGTWGTCGGGSGTGNVSTVPTASQNISQPVGTQFGLNNLNGMRYVTLAPSATNWSQSVTATVTGGTQATVTLSTCPLGIFGTDTTSYISINNGAEYTLLQSGGTCVPGGTNQTIKFTTVNSYTNPTLSSASSGIQEALTDAQASGTGGVKANFRVIFQPTNPPTTAYYAINAAVTVPSGVGDIDGSGASIDCDAMDKCFYFTYGEVAVHGFRVASKTTYAGAAITATACSNSPASGTNTITASNTFAAGQVVDIRKTDNPHYWGLHAVKSANGTSFTFLDGNNCGGATSIASAATPGGAALEHAFLEDAGEGLTVGDIYFDPPTWGAESLNNGFVIDNDQNFSADNIQWSGNGGVHCDANYCGAAFYAPGPFSTAAALGRITRSQLSMGCQGNGVEWLGGNSLKVADTVIQGFQQYGIETGTFRGGFGSTTVDNYYNEVGSCTNPIMTAAGFTGLAAYDMAGINAMGNSINENSAGTTGPAAVGQEPIFATGGATTYEYWAVICDGANCAMPMRFGQAAPTGTGAYTIGWPRYASQTGSTVTYYILRTTGAGYALTAPMGTGNWSLTAAGSPFAQCGGFVCTSTDSSTTALQAFSTGISPGLVPTVWNWPGAIVLGGGASLYSSDLPETNVSTIVPTIQNVPSVFAQRCGNPAAGLYVVCLAGNSAGNNNTAIGATLLQSGPQAGGGISGSKGRLNFYFGPAGSPQPGHLVTLVDSNPFKTLADANHRPSNDANDTYVGVDQSGGTSLIGLALGASASISNYIGNAGDNVNWGERLTASLKEFKVASKFDGAITFAGITGSGSQCLHVSSAGVLSGTGSDCGSGTGGGSGIVNSGVASQVALYSGSGAAVSGDSGLTDNGTTLNYLGSGGIAAATGAFAGNVTVNGQLLVAGPWMVSSPIPGTAMGAAGTGTSALGISNDGNFYVSPNGGTPQKVATSATSSFFSNLAQEDANDLGEFNGTNPQGLHVYGTYTNSSNYERTGLSWDASDGYFVMKDENAGTGSQRGIGFWIGSSIRWGIDTTSTLKPFANNLINLGSTTLAPQTVYAATSFDTLTQGRENFELCNDGTSGTSLNFLAVYNGATPACAVKAATSSTDGVIGIVSNGSGTTGNAVITYRGYVPCSFDGSTVTGDFVVASTTNAGDCHDAGATRPTGVQVVGRVESTNTGIGTYAVRAALESAVGAGAVTSVFGRTGVVTATSGDYAVAQVTGAAPLASPGLTGTPTTPTAAANTNTTQIASTAFVVGQMSPNTTADPWMPTGHYAAGINFSTTANKAIFTGVVLTYPKTTTQVTYLVSTADNTANTYDIGIYSGTSGGSCTQVAHLGSTAGTTFAPTAATWKTASWTGGSVTLQPGRYYLAYTTSCTSSCAAMGGDSGGFTFAGNSGGASSNASVTTGGTLPTSVTCPTDSYTASSMPVWAIN